MASVIEREESVPVLDWQNRRMPMADTPELRAALDEANVPTLLLVYVHLTHDESMLSVAANYIRPPFSSPGTEFPDEFLPICAPSCSPY